MSVIKILQAIHNDIAAHSTALYKQATGQSDPTLSKASLDRHVGLQGALDIINLAANWLRQNPNSENIPTSFINPTPQSNQSAPESQQSEVTNG